MTPQTVPYDYENRQGIRPISWEDFHALCKGLALAIAPYDPEIILGIARAGLYPATLISHLLRCELYGIRLTRRRKDVVEQATPVWLQRPPDAVAGRRVLIVDEICDSGETLGLARPEVLRMGASQALCAVLYSHSWGQSVPDYAGLISDALLMNPWDREIVQDGEIVFHPEYAGALASQGITPEPALLLDVGIVCPAKQAGG
jgi:uncharacterized protein